MGAQELGLRLDGGEVESTFCIEGSMGGGTETGEFEGGHN